MSKPLIRFCGSTVTVTGQLCARCYRQFLPKKSACLISSPDVAVGVKSDFGRLKSSPGLDEVLSATFARILKGGPTPQLSDVTTGPGKERGFVDRACDCINRTAPLSMLKLPNMPMMVTFLMFEKLPRTESTWWTSILLHRSNRSFRLQAAGANMSFSCGSQKRLCKRRTLKVVWTVAHFKILASPIGSRNATRPAARIADVLALQRLCRNGD